jgi:hypothetical protein
MNYRIYALVLLRSDFVHGVHDSKLERARARTHVTCQQVRRSCYDTRDEIRWSKALL